MPIAVTVPLLPPRAAQLSVFYVREEAVVSSKNNPLPAPPFPHTLRKNNQATYDLGESIGDLQRSRTSGSHLCSCHPLPVTDHEHDHGFISAS